MAAADLLRDDIAELDLRSTIAFGRVMYARDDGVGSQIGPRRLRIYHLVRGHRSLS